MPASCVLTSHSRRFVAILAFVTVSGCAPSAVRAPVVDDALASPMELLHEISSDPLRIDEAFPIVATYRLHLSISPEPGTELMVVEARYVAENWANWTHEVTDIVPSHMVRTCLVNDGGVLLSHEGGCHGPVQSEFVVEEEGGAAGANAHWRALGGASLEWMAENQVSVGDDSTAFTRALGRDLTEVVRARERREVACEELGLACEERATYERDVVIDVRTRLPLRVRETFGDHVLTDLEVLDISSPA